MLHDLLDTTRAAHQDAATPGAPSHHSPLHLRLRRNVQLDRMGDSDPALPLVTREQITTPLCATDTPFYLIVAEAIKGLLLCANNVY